METIVKIGFSVIIAMILWGFVTTVKHAENFKKGLESHLLNNSMLHSKVTNTRNVESNNKSFK